MGYTFEYCSKVWNSNGFSKTGRWLRVSFGDSSTRSSFTISKVVRGRFMWAADVPISGSSGVAPGEYCSIELFKLNFRAEFLELLWFRYPYFELSAPFWIILAVRRRGDSVVLLSCLFSKLDLPPCTMSNRVGLLDRIVPPLM